ncbi:MAG: hypothetical protein Q7R60_00665 [bacterium]|nr:hypothetical protein [bacterium]
MEIPRAARPSANEQATVRKWSVLEGQFRPPPDFPDHELVEAMLESSRIWDDERQKRVYCSRLLLYALQTCMPELFSTPEQTRQVGRDVTSAVGATLELTEHGLGTDRDAITDTTSEPALDPKEVPVMQAIESMQQGDAIDYLTKRILDAAVRTMHTKQSAK